MESGEREMERKKEREKKQDKKRAQEEDEEYKVRESTKRTDLN